MLAQETIAALTADLKAVREDAAMWQAAHCKQGEEIRALTARAELAERRLAFAVEAIERTQTVAGWYSQHLADTLAKIKEIQ